MATVYRLQNAVTGQTYKKTYNTHQEAKRVAPALGRQLGVRVRVVQGEKKDRP